MLRDVLYWSELEMSPCATVISQFCLPNFFLPTNYKMLVKIVLHKKNVFQLWIRILYLDKITLLHLQVPLDWRFQELEHTLPPTKRKYSFEISPLQSTFGACMLCTTFFWQAKLQLPSLCYFVNICNDSSDWDHTDCEICAVICFLMLKKAW